MIYLTYPSYSEIFADYIEESGMTLGEIAIKMEEKGVRIDRSYISMLKNNKTKNPASDEVNRAIAEITGGDPERLIYAAYVEKAPEEMRDLLRMVGDIDYLLHKLLVYYGKYLDDNNLVTQSDPSLNFISESLEEYDVLTLAQKIELLRSLVEDAKSREIDPVKIIDDSFSEEDNEEEMNDYYKEYMDEILPILSADANRFYPALKQELRDFTKENKGPLKLVTTPNNVRYLFVEKRNEYKEFIKKLENYLHAVLSRYEINGFRHPGFIPGVNLKLDQWLERGNILYKDIELTPHDKSLITIYAEALLSDRITNRSGGNSES